MDHGLHLSAGHSAIYMCTFGNCVVLLFVVCCVVDLCCAVLFVGLCFAVMLC